MGQIYPDDWHDAVELFQTVPSPRIVVCGRVGAGKSSFIRFATSKMLEKCATVCRLEGDCGQPDNTPPGVLSLSLSHAERGKKVQIVSQRFLGFVTPGTEPVQYMAVVSKVYHDYVERFSDIPLFVNMHGWNNGVGLLTWKAAVTVVQPDFVVHIGADEAQFEIPERNPFLDGEYAVPSPRWIKLSKVIVLPGDKVGEELSKEVPSDRRWKRFASHFRPDLMYKNEFKSCHPNEFFKDPYVKVFRLPRAETSIEFPCCDLAPPDPHRAILSTIVGLVNKESGQLVCLGYVASCDDSEIRILIPPNIPVEFGECIDTIIRGEMNWSPRERVRHNGKITSTDFLPHKCDPEGMPYFLPNSLDDDLSKTASTRTNLLRKRLMGPKE
jgi:hypothetical protein